MEQTLKCSKCDFDFNHLKAVTWLYGPDDYYSTHSVTLFENAAVKVNVEHIKTTHRVRGAGLILTFHCENGHEHSVQYMNHKGQVFLEHGFIKEIVVS